MASSPKSKEDIGCEGAPKSKSSSSSSVQDIQQKFEDWTVIDASASDEEKNGEQTSKVPQQDTATASKLSSDKPCMNASVEDAPAESDDPKKACPSKDQGTSGDQDSEDRRTPAEILKSYAATVELQEGEGYRPMKAVEGQMEAYVFKVMAGILDLRETKGNNIDHVKRMQELLKQADDLVEKSAAAVEEVKGNDSARYATHALDAHMANSIFMTQLRGTINAALGAVEALKKQCK